MSAVRQAVILAGGRGTRLAPFTNTVPKPLVAIHGKPFAEYLINALRSNGVEEVVFLTGYLAEQFPQTLGDGSRFGVKLVYKASSVEDETGERLKKAKQLLDDRFLLLYGDNYWPLDLEARLAFHNRMQVPASLTVYVRDEEGKKNNIKVSREGLVEAYDKNREVDDMNGVDIGFYILEKSVLDLLPSHNANFESSVLPQLIEEKRLAGFVTRHPYWGLTDAARLPAVEQALNPRRKVLFLDRDGVLNVKAPKAEYIMTPDAFNWLPDALKSLQELADIGYEFYIVSNQAGIAKGVMTTEGLSAIHDKMRTDLNRVGVDIQDIYYCPHDWESPCDCRKPKPGMFYQAAREHNIDLSRAVFVGDDERDKEAGEAAGIKTFLVSKDVGIAAALPMLLSQ